MSGAVGEFAFRAYQFLLPAAWVLVLVSVFVLGPLALMRTTRPWAGMGMMLGSYVIGLTTWLLGSAVTLGTYGWTALIIGWLLLGVGVVPIAVFAAFFALGNPGLGVSLIVMSAVAFAIRGIGSAIVDS
jgi:hypothetical protein